MTTENWLAQNLRVTFIFGGPAEIDFSWRDVVGTDPEVEEFKPREGVRRHAGPYAGADLEIVRAVNRIDIRLTPSSALRGGMMPVVSYFAGEFDKSIQAISEITNKFIQLYRPACRRFAIGGLLLSEARDYVDATQIVGRLIKSIKVSPLMYDFSYRVNWKKEYENPSIGYFNRITTWSVTNIQVVGQNSGQGGSNVTFLNKTFASLELDFNTPVEVNADLAPGSLTEIAADLLDEVLMAVSYGERCP